MSFTSEIRVMVPSISVMMIFDHKADSNLIRSNSQAYKNSSPQYDDVFRPYYSLWHINHGRGETRPTIRFSQCAFCGIILHNKESQK